LGAVSFASAIELAVNIGKKSQDLARFSLVGTIALVLAGRLSAQTLTNLYSLSATPSSPPYTNSDGAGASVALVLSGNTFYGTTAFGGSSGNGTVFSIKTDGTDFTNLHSFTATSGTDNTNSDGANPYGGLAVSSNLLYGASRNGGGWGNGTVFALNTDGTGFTNLHSFTAATDVPGIGRVNTDGANPEGGLVLSNHTLFGTTVFGGTGGNGAVFALNVDGSFFTNFHNFTATSGTNGINSDGANPYAGLVLSGYTLFGTSRNGGNWGKGTVFALNTFRTTFTNLHSFTATSGTDNTNSDGANPSAVLLLSGNTLYGTASSGGGWREGTVFAINTNGTGFTNLHSFTGGFLNGLGPIPDSDGGSPVGGLVLWSNTLYGTTQYGGTTNYPFAGSGTVFALNTNGTGFTNLWRFSAISTNPPYGNTDGAFPEAGLVLRTNALLRTNTLYGAASGGGSSGGGAIFSLSLPWPPLRPPIPATASIYADFTTSTIRVTNMTITPGAYFTYNTSFPGSWDIAGVSFGFIGTFDVPSTGTYKLTVNHQTSAAASCPGGGYSPVNIYINGTQIASNFDPAQQSGGNLGEVTNSWTITATAGAYNTLQWAAGQLCSRYWIQRIQITPVPSPLLSWSAASNRIVLDWNTNLVGFVLESSASLGGVWLPVSPAAVVVGSTNFSTNTITAPAQFYRLHNTTPP
jgi:uncharacterized repeat protein (TIGR03803 family)